MKKFAVLAIIAVIALLYFVEAGKPQLKIGVTHRPEECTRKTKIGDTLMIHYTGTLEDGTKFDSSLDRGDPFQFKLGAGQVIQGWDRGLVGMCVGEKRRLRIPAELGYGSRGAPPTIPADANLIFTTELIDIAH